MEGVEPDEPEARRHDIHNENILTVPRPARLDGRMETFDGKVLSGTSPSILFYDVSIMLLTTVSILLDLS